MTKTACTEDRFILFVLMKNSLGSQTLMMLMIISALSMDKGLILSVLFFRSLLRWLGL